MKKESSGTGSVAVNGLIQITLIVLKMCGVIDWHWWQVLAPMWCTAASIIVITVIAIIIELKK